MWAPYSAMHTRLLSATSSTTWHPPCSPTGGVGKQQPRDEAAVKVDRSHVDTEERRRSPSRSRHFCSSIKQYPLPSAAGVWSRPATSKRRELAKRTPDDRGRRYLVPRAAERRPDRARPRIVRRCGSVRRTRRHSRVGTHLARIETHWYRGRGIAGVSPHRDGFPRMSPTSSTAERLLRRRCDHDVAAGLSIESNRRLAAHANEPDH